MPNSNAFRRCAASLRSAGLAGIVLLAGCMSPQTAGEPAATAKPGLEFRIASIEPCVSCEEIRRAPPQATLYLQRRPLMTSADIAGITRAYDPISGSPALQFAFRADAQERIHTVTAQNVGKIGTWVKDGRIIFEAHIVGAFSESMQLTSVGRAERDRLYGVLTGIKEPKALKQP
jgi:preprotein translocase subunit SecD